MPTEQNAWLCWYIYRSLINVLGNCHNDCDNSSFFVSEINGVSIYQRRSLLLWFFQRRILRKPKKTPMLTKLIPTIQQLETALQHFRIDFSAVNCSNDHFTSSLQKMFEILEGFLITIIANVLNQGVKLIFAVNQMMTCSSVFQAKRIWFGFELLQ